MLLDATEVDVELMEGCEEGAEGGAFGHLGEGIDILGEALAPVAELAIRTWDIGVGVVDITRQEHTGVDLAPVTAHLFAVLAAGIEIGDLIGPEDIMHILGELGLQWSHNSELLAYEDLGEQLMSTCEHHSLLLEVLDMGALGEELRHIAYLMACLL